MFELFRYDRQLHRTPSLEDAAIPAAPAIASKSFLFWGEHCVECAAPDCYSSCSLYSPRDDGRCRRFEFGMSPSGQAAGRAGAELVFKKWGQLGTRGNVKLESVERLRRREKWIRRLVPVVDRVGTLVWRATRDRRFRESSQRLLERYCRSLHARATAADKPDCFLLEFYNPAEHLVRFQLRVSAANSRATAGALIQIRPAFQSWLEAPPGYSRHQLDYELFRKIVEREPFDISLTPEGEQATRIVVLTADFVTFEAATPVAGEKPRPAIKCMVWDLDHTVWDGILVENDNVQLRPGILDTIRHLDSRGILHSVASKNSHDHAWLAIERVGLSEYLLYPQISWMPKSGGIRKIAEQLNISLDTFAFVDDNEAELDQIRATLPEVTCIHVDQLTTALQDPRFAGSATADAKTRRSLYKQAIVRDEALQEFGADYLKFLAHSEIVLELDSYAEEYFERINELVQRTNQLNFSGRKYKLADVSSLLADGSVDKFVLRCADRYGAYGTVGFAIVSTDGGMIKVQDFMLSCRVQGKFIEQAFFRHLLDHYDIEAARLWLNFNRTDRNTPALNVLTTLGFVDDPNGGMFLDLTPESLLCAFIETKCGNCASNTPP